LKKQYKKILITKASGEILPFSGSKLEQSLIRSGVSPKLPGHATKFHQGWLVTNTRFTGDAIQYGNCAGLKLIGWDYPAEGSLKDLYVLECMLGLQETHLKN
jgi:hypothetical protein